MNLNIIQPTNETKDLWLWITKNCEKPIEQTRSNADETLEFKMIKPRETFHFNPPIQIKRGRMIALTSLEIYNSYFNITEKNNKVGLYTDTFDEFSFTELKDELEEILNISNMTSKYLQDDIMGPHKISA